MGGRSPRRLGRRETSGASTRARDRSCTRPCASFRAMGWPRSGARRRAMPARHGPSSVPHDEVARGSTAGAALPAAHVRDLRSELMLKLLFLDRSRPRPHSASSRPASGARAHGGGTRGAAEVCDRLSPNAESLAALGRPCSAFIRGRPARQSRRRTDRLPPDRVRQLAAHRVERDAAASNRRHERHVDDRGLEPAQWMPRGSRRLLPRLGHRPPRRGRGLGLDGANISRQRTAWNVRDALAAASESGRTLARSYRQRGVRLESSWKGLDLLDGTPVLDLKPFVPLFDTASDDVRIGWFELHADGVFTRTSDDRFALRSRRA